MQPHPLQCYSISVFTRHVLPHRLFRSPWYSLSKSLVFLRIYLVSALIIIHWYFDLSALNLCIFQVFKILNLSMQKICISPNIWFTLISLMFYNFIFLDLGCLLLDSYLATLLFTQMQFLLYFLSGYCWPVGLLLMSLV